MTDHHRGAVCMRRSSAAILTGVLLLVPVTAEAAGNKTLTKTGDILRFALPAAAAGISLYKSDYTGLAQLIVAYGATVGIAEGLKHVVHERRPDGSDFHSFPSASAASAQAASAYLWHRYGWQYGLPAFGLAVLTGYSRVQAKKHHWYDVLASDGIAFGVNLLVVTRYHRRFDPYALSMGATPDSVSVNFTMRF